MNSWQRKMFSAMEDGTGVNQWVKGAWLPPHLQEQILDKSILESYEFFVTDDMEHFCDNPYTCRPIKGGAQ